MQKDIQVKFTVSVDDLVRFMEKAPSRLSSLGQQHSRPTSAEKNKWHDLIGIVKNHQRRLHDIDAGNPTQDEINSTISFFKQLPKRLDYQPYYWSDYYNDIQECLNQLSMQIDEIENT